MVILLLQLAFWLSAARDNVYGHASAHLAVRHLEDVEEAHLPRCIAGEPKLQARTPSRLMRAVASAAATLGAAER